ncbi:MAG: glutathione peroxidase [Pseudolabrys sp.]
MFARRHFLRMSAGALLAPCWAAAETGGRTAYSFTFKALDGSPVLLSSYRGRPILVVNTASLCGYTPQYTGLQELWARYRDRGLMLIGVPSNDFGGQEPGGPADIDKTAHGYHVTFPLTEKVAVKGPDAHPFYRWAALERPLETPRWNFHKYLVARDGRLRTGFASAVVPTDPRVISAIEQELAGA